MPLILTTTGNSATVSLPELDLLLTHPQTVNLSTEGFIASDIIDAPSIQTEIDATNLVATDLSSNPVTNTTFVDLAVDVEGLLSSSNPVSTDVNNIIVPGTDSKAWMDAAIVQANQNEGSLTYSGGTTTLTYTGANGTVQNIDLSSLTTDIYVDGATLTGGLILTLTDNDGTTPDVTVDLSTLQGSFTNLTGGSWQYDQGDGTLFDITTLAAEGTQILSVGANNGLLLTQADIQANETTTSLAYVSATRQLTYTDEDAAATNLDLTQAIDDLSDVDTTTAAPAIGQTLQWDGTNWVPVSPNVYGTERNFFEYKGAALITTSSTPQNVISNATTPLPVGDYKITISYNFNFDNNQNDFLGYFLFDGSALGRDASGNVHRQEPKDSAGGFDGTNSNQKYAYTRTFHTSVAAAGAKSVLLQYASSDNLNEAAIWDAEIEIIRVA